MKQAPLVERGLLLPRVRADVEQREEEHDARRSQCSSGNHLRDRMRF